MQHRACLSGNIGLGAKRKKIKQNKMKIKISSLIVLFLSVFSVFSQNPFVRENNKTDVEREGLKGNVKQIEQNCFYAKEESGKIKKGENMKTVSPIDVYGNYLFLFDKNGNKIEERWRDTASVQFSKTINVYDEKGNNIETNAYNRSGTKIITKTVSRFDDKKNILELDSYEYDGTLKSKTVFTYDNNGKMVAAIEYNGDGSTSVKYKWSYNYRGSISEEQRLNKSGDLDSRITYVYDDKENKIEMKQYLKTDTTFYWKEVYKYDEGGRMIGKDIDCFEKFQNTIETYQYDSKANKTGRDLHEKNGEVYLAYRWEYEYDKYGNWIKKIEFKNNSPKIIITRMIVYF